MKLLIRGALVLLALVVVLVVAVVVYIDAIAESAVEYGASTALGVPTALEDADVGILAGEFTMTGLDVANPPEFDREDFLRMRHGHVALRLRSLRAETIELPTLTLEDLHVSLEKKQGRSNYDVILGNLSKYESDEPQVEPEPPAGAGKRFIIRELLVRDVEVDVELLPVGGELNRITVPIEEIRLADVGSHTDRGVLLPDLFGVLVKAILGAVARNTAELPADLVTDLDGALENVTGLAEMGIGATFELGSGLTGSIGEALRGVGGPVGEAGKGVGDIGEGIDDAGEGVGKAIEGLGGLLGGDKDRKKDDADDDGG